ncbi:hypothetical protein ES704_00728 [subsurface metagenome]|jgi:hypothetical protein
MGLKKRDNKCVRGCVGGRFFVTLQEYIFTLLNRHQRLKELVFLNFSTP